MPRIAVERAVSADPVSTALLLTGADALTWWPGLQIEQVAPSVVLATVTHGGRASAVSVRVLPPHRTGTSFITRFEVHGGEFALTRGSLELQFVPGGTRAALELDGPAEALAGPARRFLANLAQAAENRSSAA